MKAKREKTVQVFGKPLEFIASRTYAEKDFNGRKRWVHARKGDRGRVLWISPEGVPAVRFERSGTVTDVYAEDGDWTPKSRTQLVFASLMLRGKIPSTPAFSRMPKDLKRAISKLTEG